MEYGCYASIGEVKDALGVTGTTDDTIIRRDCEGASRAIDQYCNRHFYVVSATRYFRGATKLWIPDLLSITTLKTDEDGDATFENTLTTSDYLLYGVGLEDTLNTFPKIRIEISDDSDYSSFGSGIKKGVEIAGLWGYGDGSSATPYIADTTLSAAISSTTATTCTVTSATNLSAGQNILIDDEQFYISSISSSTLTVIRGINGTTAATHNNSTTISIYQYPPDIRGSCIDLVGFKYQYADKQGVQSERIGDYSYTLVTGSSTQSRGGAVGNILDSNISAYRRMRV